MYTGILTQVTTHIACLKPRLGSVRVRPSSWSLGFATTTAFEQSFHFLFFSCQGSPARTYKASMSQNAGERISTGTSLLDAGSGHSDGSTNVAEATASKLLGASIDGKVPLRTKSTRADNLSRNIRGMTRNS